MATSITSKAKKKVRLGKPMVEEVPGHAVVLWTIQPLEVWESLQARGTLHVDPVRVSGREGVILPAYQWLATQLRGRLNGSGWQLPWWAYCKRPDLRSMRHGQRGPQTLIELSPPAGSFVSFPCWAWAQVFFGEYLAVSKSQQRAWERRVRGECGRRWRDIRDRLPAPLQQELETSWERLFSPRLPSASWKPGGIGADREAVLAQLRREWVRSVTHFQGCRSW